MMSDEKNIFNKELKVINIGVDIFSEALKAQDVEVVNIDWRPPAGGDLEVLKLLERLEEG